jgi:hypothetical protein
MEPEIYLIVSSKRASLTELDTDYSVSDVYDLLEVIDLENDIEKAAEKDADQAKPRGGR